MSQSRKVVVTGMGVISNYGHSVDEFWNNIVKGNSAIKPWAPENVTDFPVKYAAKIDFEYFKKQYSKMVNPTVNLDRRGYFGLVAAAEAIRDARLDLKHNRSVGVSVCSGVPDVSGSDLLLFAGENKQHAMKKLINVREEISEGSSLRNSNDAMATRIADEFQVSGPVLNINGACAGATQAIGIAYQTIRRGETDVMLAGGADSVLNTRTMSGLYLLGAPSTTEKHKEKLCKPFDKDRSGLVAGEGGAMLCLESETSALARGARIYGEIVGYGSSLDAYKITAPHPEGTGAVAAMQKALTDAKLQPKHINYINAHGTSTPLNDIVETKAIKNLFDARCRNKLLVSSTKSMIGHWIAAAGAPEAIVTILSLKTGIVTPTINTIELDEEFDLNYVLGDSYNTDINYAMSNSFGFGGINASLIFKRYVENENR